MKYPNLQRMRLSEKHVDFQTCHFLKTLGWRPQAVEIAGDFNCLWVIRNKDTHFTQIQDKTKVQYS